MSIISRLLPLVFSANFLNSVVRVSTPLILCAMAACIGKQANVQTITYEGMMLLAAFAGNLGTSYAKSLAGGIIIGLLASLAIAVFYGFFNIYLDTYDTLLGIAVNNFVSFFTIFMLFVLIGRKSDSSTIPSFTYPIVNIPSRSKISFFSHCSICRQIRPFICPGVKGSIPANTQALKKATCAKRYVKDLPKASASPLSSNQYINCFAKTIARSLYSDARSGSSSPHTAAYTRQ